MHNEKDMPQCLVKTCGNYYGKTRGGEKVIYHMLPSKPELQARWVEVCTNTKTAANAYARVCSQHFSVKCYQRDLQHELLGLPLRRKLKADAVPDQNLPGKVPVNVLTTKSDNNDNKGRSSKLPMRSSFRIAKKKSIESCRNMKDCRGSDCFSDKVKFMAKLLLKFERKENVALPKYDLGLSLDRIEEIQCAAAGSR